MNRMEMLNELQRVDTERLRAARELEGAESSLGETEDLRQSRETATREEIELTYWRGRLRDLDLKLKGISEKIGSTEKRLYGGGVRNPRELGNLQTDLEQLRQRREKTEDDLLEAMAEVDDREAKSANTRLILSQTEAQWNAEQDRLQTIIEQLGQELEVLETESLELRSSIDKADVALYDRLMRTKGGRAVAVLEGEMCGGCRVRMPSGLTQRVRQGQELTVCNSCGRILVKS